MEKKALRSIYLAKRKDLIMNDKVLFEEAILRLLVDSFDFENKIISCFLPISKKHEIDTWPIISKLTEKGGQIALSKWNFEKNELTHVLYSIDIEIENNSFGIPEPKEGIPIDIGQMDVVIVPLLIADRCGNRVGYGKGVYDRFLAKCHPKTKFIGVSLFELIDKIVDVDGNDVPLHLCITPTKIHSFEK